MSEAGERHASWLELFFDLVVVVAVAQLAHRLEHPTWTDLGLFVVLYYAVWSVWTSLTLYTNVRGDKARTRSVLVGMFGIAVMAAAAPHVADNLPDAIGTHDAWFISAFIVCRAVASRAIQVSGAIVTGWPAAQLGVGLAPWILSFWADDPAWRYGLWGLGVVLDVVITISQARRPDQLVNAMRGQALRQQERFSRRGRTPTFAMPSPATLHSAHLGERLGLFVIIVLGEAVMGVVIATSAITDWDTTIGLAALAGFGLIVTLWWLTLQYGLSAVPQASESGLKPILILPAHFLMTAAITAVAAGLAVTAEHTATVVPTGIRWLLCAGLALYFAVSAGIGIASKVAKRWILLWALPTVAAPLLVGLFGARLAGWGLIALLLLVALWRVVYRPPVEGVSPAS